MRFVLSYMSDEYTVLLLQKQDPVENEKLCAFLVEKALNNLPMGTDNILGIFDLRGFRVENGDLQFLKFLVSLVFSELNLLFPLILLAAISL